MNGKQLVFALLTMSFCTVAFSDLAPVPVPAAASDQYCGKLAQIGASAFRTRNDGYPMERVLTEVNSILSAKPQTMEDAHEVIVAIYADKSVSSARQAYAKVYEDCRQ
jgi:hypothetical protein|nr:hypothetical protein [uncultured Noviherbaspirillum sp.]